MEKDKILENENNESEARKEKFEEIRLEVEPILKTLDNDYSIEKGEDGTETIIVYGKNNEIVASINDKETKFFNAEFEQQFMELEEKAKAIQDKVKAVKDEEKNEKAKKEGNKQQEDTKDKEENKEEKKDEKELENKNATSKEDIKKELGEDYIVATEINDEEISKKFSAIEGFIGNPLIAYNKKENQFVIVGNNGNGKLKEAQLLTIPAQVGKSVDKYNYDGSVVEERGLVGQNIMMLPPENNDGIDLKVNEYGEIEINKIVNLRGDHPQSFPIDTKPQIPSSQEISDMKANGEKLEEIMEIMDELEAKEIINKDERNALQEQIATNGKLIDEDKAMLNDLKEEKEKEQEEKREEIEEEVEEITRDLDDDEYDPRDPRANDPRWA